MAKTFYITTAIDYTNSPPHIGHAYEKVLADVIARYHRLKGEKKTFFLTGVDQHGQKVQQSAEKAGVSPKEFVDEITAKFAALWEKLEVKYDGWAATTDPVHQKVVQGILQRLWQDVDPTIGKSRSIYKAKQAGYYSIRQEQFLTDKERGPDGEFGSEWGQVEFREEENYYFRLSQHKEWLLRYLDNRKDAVIPDFRQTELRNAVEKISGDLCISRPKSRLDWGIELPFDKDYVTYVWFDALTSYISFIGYDPGEAVSFPYSKQPAEFLEKWPALHVIGKDILVPAHGIYWLIMLHALGFPDEAMPQLLVHGWWNLGGAKMSKSAGNIVDPFALIEKYGAQAVRYYLMSDIATGKDADFSEERLVERYNADLANTLGNLLNRTLNMVLRYWHGSVRNVLGNHHAIAFMDSGDSSRAFLTDLLTGCRIALGHYGRDAMDLCAVSDGLIAALGIAHEGNFLIENWALWKLAKEPTEKRKLDAALYTLLESLRIIAILISPVLPNAAHAIFDQLDPQKKLSRDFHLENAEWGGLPDGHVVGKPVPLFPRIE